MTACRVAYLVNQYPKVSHSFIRREILALERQGVSVHRIALRGWDAELVDPSDSDERAATKYVLKGGLLPLLWSALRLVAKNPIRFLAALRRALAMARHAERPWPYHLVYLLEACQVYWWVRDEAVEHLHAHFGTNSAEVVMLVHMLGGPPYSFTVHGPEEFDKPEFIHIGEKIQSAQFVVAISSYGRSQLYRWVGHEHWHKVKVVHCGIDAGFWRDIDAGLPETPRLVCVGRLCEQKGQLLLIEAAHRLAKDGVDFELVLAGDGEMRDEIEQLIGRYGLSNKVRITGWVSSSRVREEILAAKGLVLPSFAEGLPVVLMEAMALRRSVLTTYVAGIPELVIHGENGLLFPAGSVEELATAMKAFLALPDDQIEAMGEAACRRVMSRHNVDQEATKLASLFAAAGNQ